MMLEAIASRAEALLAASDDAFLLYAGVFVRMGAAAYLAPGLGESVTPARVRLFAAFALTLVAAPAALEAGPAPPVGLAALAMMLGAEAGAGVLVGLTVRLIVTTLHIAGAIAAQSMQLTQLFGPGVGHEQESQLSTMLVMAGIAIACASGVHIQLALALAQTYEILPFGLAFPAGDAARHIVEHSGRAISLGVALAAPFLVLGFLYALALGAMNRAMPQLAVAFVGAPAAISAGVALFALTCGLLLAQWSTTAGDVFAAPLAGPR